MRPLGAPHARKKPRPRRSKRPKVASSSVKAAAAPDADLFGGEDDELLEEGDIPDPDDEDPSEQAEVVAGPEDWQDGVDAETGKFLWFNPEECEDENPALVSSTDEEGETVSKSAAKKGEAKELGGKALELCRQAGTAEHQFDHRFLQSVL